MDYPREYNAAVDFVDRNVELHEQCGRVGRLLSDHGLGAEARVAMLVLDTVDFPIIFFGAIRAGVIPVALNTLLTTDQYRYILGDCRARALFISAPLLPTVEPILGELPFLEHVFVVGGGSGAYHDFTAELASRPADGGIQATARANDGDGNGLSDLDDLSVRDRHQRPAPDSRRHPPRE